MLTLIHGEDITNSRNFFVAQKQIISDAITFEGIALQLGELTQALKSDRLFILEKNIFINELLSKRKQGKEVQAIIDFLIANEGQANIFLWESKELTAKQLTPFKKAIIKKFAISKTIFQMLDAIRPNNGRALLTLFHKTLEHEDEQFVFFMLVKQIRMLLAFSDESQMPIDEVKRLAPWQKNKLEKQAGFFSQDTLQSLYRQLFAIDLAQKTGGLAYPVSTSIDFLLAKI